MFREIDNAIEPADPQEEMSQHGSKRAREQRMLKSQRMAQDTVENGKTDFE